MPLFVTQITKILWIGETLKAMKMLLYYFKKIGGYSGVELLLVARTRIVPQIYRCL